MILTPRSVIFDPLEGDGSFRRDFEKIEAAKKRRFAAAGRANDHQHLAAAHFRIHAVERLDLAADKLLM